MRWLDTPLADGTSVAADLGAPTELEQTLEGRVRERMKKGSFNEPEIRYIRTMPLRAIEGSLEVNDVHLARLRNLCGIWDVALKPRPITSHRRFVGPIIVAAKRLVFPILKAFFEPSLRQQRMFNAQVLAHLIDLTPKAQKNQ